MFKKSSRSKTVVLVVRGSPEGPITKKDSSGIIWYRSGRLEKQSLVKCPHYAGDIQWFTQRSKHLIKMAF